MNKAFYIKNDKELTLLSFQFHTLDYSLGIFKNKRNELKKNPILKQKINYYLMLKKISMGAISGITTAKVDIDDMMKDYINNPINKDLKTYIDLCNHIVAKELDMAELCSRVIFITKYFRLIGNDLVAYDNSWSTLSGNYTEYDKKFLCSCAKRKKLIIDDSQVVGNYTLYNQQNQNSLIQMY